MCSEMRVEVIDKEIVTPSSPTPHHLTTSNLSVFDQFLPDLYVPLLLFYPNNSTINHKGNMVDHHYSLITERSKLLKTSLSETLSRFYPFAGRIFSHNNILSICCNDQGVAFIQTHVNCPISKVLEKPHAGMLNQLLPNDIESTFESTGYLLLVQANFFECGGIAIGVSISHKIADGFTLGTFIRSWAAMGLVTDVVALPTAEFGVAASLWPPQDLSIKSLQTSREYVYEDCLKRRFFFDASNILRLKSKAASAIVPNPTRVEVVSALIWKCAMDVSRSNFGVIRPAMLFLAANMRKVLGHPTLMGNLLGYVPTKTQESEATLQSLVAILREGIEKFKVNYGNGVSGDDICQHFKEHEDLMGKNDINNYTCSSWCRFGFYEANFGWGKPSWVTMPGMPIKNVIILIDAKDGEGVEALLSFKEDDMAIIETNKELLAYASLNPIAI
ncbi:putative salutaridinol 7-O-acetyltransferase [Rosa chinensis]|uniref:Putative salutaridinol 7-O-acetyltransferase n=1 Tax=Rosa chinensis TaxID=74649 RepID=A0A2P6QWQ6_ROSCH|nr:BAHD acyltransferase At5g47980 [Rosa chinensis]PRQ38584.1 putative salutaridinol 7-O-acetyltransferase [Rosa chinensis]